MVARKIKRAFYVLIGTSGVALAVVALFLLTQTVQKSDDFDRLQDVILAINIAGGVLLIAMLIALPSPASWNKYVQDCPLSSGYGPYFSP